MINFDIAYRKSMLLTKFHVQMTPLAMQVVSQKLRQDNLVMLATIINQKVIFEKIEPVDPNIVEADSRNSWSLITLPGYNPGGICRFRSKYQLNVYSCVCFHFAIDSVAEKEISRLTLGVAGMGDIARHWKERSALFADIEFPDVLHDSLLQSWSEKLIRPRAILRKLARKDGSIPPAFDERAIEQLLQRAGDAFSKLSSQNHSAGSNEATGTNSINVADDSYVPGKYGDTLNPSIVCATIGNAYDHLTSMDVSSSVSQIAAGFHDNMVRVWRIDQTPEEQKKIPWFGRNLQPPYDWEINQVLPAPSGDHVVQSKAHHANNSSKSPFPCLEFVGHSMPVYSVTQSECERFVFSGSADETIRVWDTSVVQCVGRYHCFSTPWCVRTNPIDAYYFAGGHSDRSVSVYSMDHESPIRLMTGHTSDVNVLAWHGNGTLLASGSDDRSARLWDIRTAECVRIFHHCAAPITALQVSSLGTLLAAGTDQGTIYVWDIRSSRQLAILQGHTEEITSLSFSKDRNQALASGAMDCSVRIWDIRLALETTYNPSPASGSTHRSMSAGIDAAHLPSAQAHDYSVSVLKARNVYFTKACPVFSVGYTDRGMVYCGGMYSASAASGKIINKTNQISL